MDIRMVDCICRSNRSCGSPGWMESLSLVLGVQRGVDPIR